MTTAHGLNDLFHVDNDFDIGMVLILTKILECLSS